MRAFALLALLLLGATAPVRPAIDERSATRAALRAALLERQAAQNRTARLEREAAAARDAAERTARQSAALAARIQQAEAGIAAATARRILVEREQAALRETLGRQQQPVVHLTAALQQFSRRPVALAVLRPGSVQDVVHLRAVLASAVPQIQARTAGIRAQIARGRQLRAEADRAEQVLSAEQAELTRRRSELAALESRQRLASRQAGGTADREAERALALAEEVRDLDALVGELDRAGSLRRQLAALPGPVLRPASPGRALAVAEAAPAPDQSAAAPRPYLLPVTGRLVSGFGVSEAGARTSGLRLAPQGGAQVVAPGAGRVAFAGPYRGYGRIVILEHAGGWTSLVTGLARVDVTVGEQLVAGAPLGIAGQARPAITLELRRAGQPVNPLPFVG